MKKKLFLRYTFWFMALGVAVLIFFFSAQNEITSAGTSTGLIHQLLTWFYPRYSQLTPQAQLQLLEAIHIPVRKLAHFAVYAALGFFTAGATYTYRLPKPKAAGIALAICILRAVADEIHQGFVPGRGPGVLDVCIDAVGAMVGILVLTACYIIYVNHRKKRFV